MKKETVIKQLMKKHKFDDKLKNDFGKTSEDVKSIKRYILQQYVKVTDKYVFENKIESILSEKSEYKNKKLIDKLLKEYDVNENRTCYENGNYIKISINNKDYILDINVNREKRIDILDKLDDILDDISK